MLDYSFTLNALQACLEANPSHDWFAKPTVIDPATTRVEVLDADGTRFFVHEKDEDDVPLIFIANQGDSLFSPAPHAAYRDIFYRLDRFAREAASPPLVLPFGWSKFQYGSLVAFFACQRALGSFRWIAELGNEVSPDVCFWTITSGDAQIQLEQFEPPEGRRARVRSAWRDVYPGIRSNLAQLPDEALTDAIQDVMDFEATTFGAVTQHRSYADWTSLLTDPQRRFVLGGLAHSIKLRGPAGSGKTLALELKALHEADRAAAEHRDIAILFATHSWAVAEQVDNALISMDERGFAESVQVFPLTEIAQDLLPTERTGLDVLGEDSLTGKRLQIERIDQVLDHLVRADWLAYSGLASVSFRRRVEASRGSAERNALVWDLMVEFACVLSANGILPGINAERQYLRLSRSPWMMPLAVEADKRFVLHVYTRYVNGLRDDRTITSDQLINDFLNYLETFTWNVRREQDGFDLIFVDELHLFTEQERLVLQYLTRAPDAYPLMFMALDPRQSPAEMYVDVAPDAITQTDPGRVEEDLPIEAVDLTTVHRFGHHILALVRHINQSYPALSLGEDWELDLSAVVAAGPSDSVPVLRQHATVGDEVDATLARSIELQQGLRSGDGRVAIILLEPLELDRYRTAAARLGESRFSTVTSRDDVDSLRYSKRSVVIGAAEFLGGLQFSSVLVTSLPSQVGSANMGHQRRRFLSLLYLAISRATTQVELHVNDEQGGIPEILATARDNGLLHVAE